MKKPLTVNQCWQGRRFATPKYKHYIEDVLALLPDTIMLPDGEIELHIDFGVSNRAQDIDNGLKPLLDILQKAYEFNDNRIYGLMVRKSIVPKGEEYSRFQTYEYDPETWEDLWR